MLDYPLADSPLAARIELAGSDDLCAYLESSRASGIYPNAECFRVGGGAAVWFSPGNVVNGSFGLGLDRPVEREEIAALVAFFLERDTVPRVDVCPHAHRSLMRWLAEAGFVATDFEMVLYQPLPAPDILPCTDGVSVRLATSAEDRAVWAELEARGFTEDSPTPEHHVLARAISLREDAFPFIGYLDGQPAGTGMLAIAQGVAMFNGDSTLPSARNRGVQTALLSARVAYAAEAGCELAVIESAPGGTSQRNQLRAGFRVAYNRVTLELPRRPA